MSSLMPLASSRNPTGLSTKALKTMGLSVQDLFESFMGPRGGQLSRQEFIIFWNAVGSADAKDGRETATVLKLFVKALTEVSTDASKRMPEFPLQSLLNTILFIALYLPVKPDTILKKLIVQLAGAVESFRKDGAPIVSYGEAVAIVKAVLVDETDAFEFLVANIHQMHTKETWQAMTEDYIPTLHRLDLVCPSFAFSYSVLLAQCRDKNRRQRISDAILNELTLIRAAPSSLAQQQSVLALLHMLRSVLSYWRAPTGPFLQSALDRICPFYSWPAPFSFVVRRVLVMLKQEMLAPGNSILERFAAESRVPETSQVSGGMMTRSRPIFYVVDAGCSLSSNFSLLIGLHNADTYIDGESNMFASGLSTEVQALLLLNILHSQSAPMDTNEIYKLTEQDVNVLFGQTVNVLQESLDISPEDAISHRERNFALIRNQFVKIAKSNEQRGVTSDLALPATLPSTLMPPLPEIAHVHWLVTRDYVLPTPETVAQLGYAPLPRTPLIDKLEKVMRLYEAFSDAQDPVEIRLCIAGSDAILHQVATAYLELMKRDTEPLKGILIRFFLVPFRNSILAAFIARFDSWYNRQLYVPFTTRNYLVPAMAEEEPLFNEARVDEPITPAGQMLQANIESYVREAEYTLQVKLFQIEGWRRIPTEEGPPDLVVPLVERAEIGRVAAAMFFKNTVREGTMATLRDLKDIFREKDFAYTPLELHVEMVRVDAIGVPHADDQRRMSAIREEPIPFDRISISNVPSADDPAHPPNPKDPWLEIFAKVSEHKSKLKNKYGFLIQEPLQHVSHLKLTTAREEQSFRVVVDGESFGPFKQVRISKIEDHFQKQATLNIATFVPIQP